MGAKFTMRLWLEDPGVSVGLEARVVVGVVYRRGCGVPIHVRAKIPSADFSSSHPKLVTVSSSFLFGCARIRRLGFFGVEIWRLGLRLL